MRVLITGICGFVGSTLARELLAWQDGIEVLGIDNLSRAGSETNRVSLQALGIRVQQGDLRNRSDLDAQPSVDWVIDAAANPSVLAGVDGATGSRQLVEHNLLGTVNMLEYCRMHGAGFILLSTSRVYSIPPLASLPVIEHSGAYALDDSNALPPAVSNEGVREEFSTAPPVSLYGATKLTSETLALEYGETFGLPVWINRCGVMAGAGQFGRPDQGIFAFWIHSYAARAALKYIGFDGQGHQVRDCLHPRDLVPLLAKQFDAPSLPVADRLVNISGGRDSAMSLRQLSEWCAERFGKHEVASDLSPRPFDLPWLILDSGKAGQLWSWKPETATTDILDEIAGHADQNPDWLSLSKV